MIAALTPALSGIAGAGAVGLAGANPVTIVIGAMLMGSSMLIKSKTRPTSPSGDAANDPPAPPSLNTPLPDQALIFRQTILDPARQAENHANYADPYRVEATDAAINQQRGDVLVLVMAWLLNSFLESKVQDWRSSLADENRSSSNWFCGSHLNLKAIANKVATEHAEGGNSLNTTTMHFKRAMTVLDAEWHIEKSFTRRELRCAQRTMVALTLATAKSVAGKRHANHEELEEYMDRPEKLAAYLISSYPLPSCLPEELTVSCIKFCWP